MRLLPRSDSARSRSPLSQTASQRAAVDTAEFARQRPWTLTLVTGLPGVTLGAAVLALVADASTLVQVGAAAISLLVGVLLAYAVVRICFLLQAPIRQRDEARAAIPARGAQGKDWVQRVLAGSLTCEFRRIDGRALRRRLRQRRSRPR